MDQGFLVIGIKIESLPVTFDRLVRLTGDLPQQSKQVVPFNRGWFLHQVCFTPHGGLQGLSPIREFIRKSGRKAEELGVLPMKARNEDMTVFLDTKTGDVIGFLLLDPW